MTYAVANIDSIEEVSNGTGRVRPIRHNLGIAAFGVTAWTGHAAGDPIINEHDEGDDASASSPDASAYGQEELYLVLRGRAVFELDGERTNAPAGTLVFVRPGVKRAAFAEEDDTTILVVGGSSTRPYEPSGWEFFGPVTALYEAGEYAEAADRGRELIATYPDYPTAIYNVACFESLAGQTVEAIEHLRRAIPMSDRLREFAKRDSDLDALRGDPAFEELIGHE